MAIHSSILAWRIPLTEKPGGLKSIGSQKVGHDWATNTHKKKTASDENWFFWFGTKSSLSICVEGGGSAHYMGHPLLWHIQHPKPTPILTFAKPFQAPTGQLFKGHLWIPRNVKKYLSPEAHIFFLLSTFICFCTSPLCSPVCLQALRSPAAQYLCSTCSQGAVFLLQH